MAFTLYSLLQAALLCVNAIAVLHEERFLKNSECRGGGGGWDSEGRLGEGRPRAASQGGRVGPAAEEPRLHSARLVFRSDKSVHFCWCCYRFYRGKAGRGVLSSELGVEALSACSSLE